jgi:hypothetical protein
MAEREELPDLHLPGGPLHRLGRRLRLVRGGTNTIPLGLAIAACTWGPVVVLALVEGLTSQVFSHALIGGHVRLLLCIPLLFACEAWLAQQVPEFLRRIVRSDIVPQASVPLLRAEVGRIARWGSSWIPEAACLMVAILLSWKAPHLDRLGASAARDPSVPVSEMTLTGQWYFLVCLPVFRFLLLRWIWRLGLWWRLLWRVSRLDLRLVPTHPDGVAGLGYLEVVHTTFIPAVFALAAIESAALAEDLAAGAIAFPAIYPDVALVMIVSALVVIAPLCVFAPKLWECRARGFADYMGLASRYVREFEAKWVSSPTAANEPLLGSSDIQSLADLSNSTARVRDLRLAPVSRRFVLSVAIAAALPFLPLTLFELPALQLAGKLLQRLAGL